jgi:hypothetical protein
MKREEQPLCGMTELIGPNGTCHNRSKSRIAIVTLVFCLIADLQIL